MICITSTDAIEIQTTKQERARAASGVFYCTEQVGPAWAVVRKTWNQGKLSESQRVCFELTEQDAEDLARKLTEETR